MYDREQNFFQLKMKNNVNFPPGAVTKINFNSIEFPKIQ